MKKILFAIALFASVGFGTTANAQCIEQGSKIVDLFYGAPDGWTSILKTAATGTGVKVTGLPIGGKFEYMVSDRIGLGAIIGFSQTTLQQDDLSGYAEKETFTRIRGMASFNLHFATGDKIDPYWMIGAGYSNWSIKYTTENPAGTSEGTDVATVPYAFRTAVGLRFFFTDNIGIHAETGFGSGAYAQFGLSAKF